MKLVLGIDAGGTTTDPLVCTPDGALVGVGSLDTAFSAEIEARPPGCDVRMPSVPPAAGAALLALDGLGSVDASVHHRLLEEAAR